MLYFHGPSRADEQPQSSTQTELIPNMGAGVGCVTFLAPGLGPGCLGPTTTAVPATLPLLPALHYLP